MAGSSSGVPPALALDQLIALNDEMAALVRAGVPLDVGLVQLGGDLPGRVGDAARMLGKRLESGENLVEILQATPSVFPSTWRAVVLAGLRSGQLTAALESLSVTSRRIADLRRGLGWALVYPFLVIALAYASFVFLVTNEAPVVLAVYENLTASSTSLLRALVAAGRSVSYWGLTIPAVVLLVVGYLWYRSGQSKFWWESSGPGRLSGFLPRGIAPFRDNRWATIAEVLALMLKNHVGLGEGLAIAAETTGDRRMVAAAHTLAERLQRGEPLTSTDPALSPFPPLIRWMLTAGAPPLELSRALSDTALRYRRRAARASTWIVVVFPLVFTVVVAGGLTLLQALATFGPLIRLLFALGEVH